MSLSAFSLVEKAKRLYDSKLYKSAFSILLFAISQLESQVMNEDGCCQVRHMLMVSLCMAGDCLFETHEYLRALRYYKLAQLNAVSAIDSSETVIELLLPIDNHSFALRLGKCYYELKQFKDAKDQLLAVPSSSRSVELWWLLALCHEESGEHRDVLWSLKNLLALEPYAVEALLKISEIGSKGVIDISHLETDSDFIDIASYVRSQFCNRLFEYKESLKILNELINHHPRCAELWRELGMAHYRNEDLHDAYFAFKQAFHLDPCLVASIDIYGGLLLSQCKFSELTELAHSSMKSSSKRPETWIVMARYSEFKNQADKAIAYANHAIQIDRKHAEAFMVKGCLLAKNGQPIDALSMFKRAHKLMPTARTYEALVSVCISLQKTREALSLTREMSHLLGGHKKTPVCVGNVLQLAGQPTKAISAYQTALKRDSNNIDSILGITSILTSQDKYEEAIEILKKYRLYHSTDWMNTRLGDIYLVRKDYQSALYHYFTALGLNPDYEAAKEGANQVERDLRGDLDEDEENTTMTQEDAADFDDDSSIIT